MAGVLDWEAFVGVVLLGRVRVVASEWLLVGIDLADDDGGEGEGFYYEGEHVAAAVAAGTAVVAIVVVAVVADAAVAVAADVAVDAAVAAADGFDAAAAARG